MSKKEDLELLNDAISLGVLVVKHGEKEIRYRSLDEMKRIRNELEDEIYGKQNNKSVKFEYKASY